MKPRRQNFVSFTQVMLLLFIVGNDVANGTQQEATLVLTILDTESKQMVPARIEVMDPQGRSYIAEDAVVIGGDCGQLTGYPGPDTDYVATQYDGSLEDALSKLPKSISPPFTEAKHFYSSGKSTLNLPDGTYTIKVFKGPEYYVGTVSINTVAGKTEPLTIQLSRMVNMPKQGWYSADDHLHIARPHKDLNPLILKMMKAEDIHVGNLLQMGRAQSFAVTPQYTHGPDSFYQEGNHIIGSGQENLRTHVLGHAVTLGAKEKLFGTNSYLNYPKFWKQAVEQNAINGFAHFGKLFPHDGNDAGLPLFLHHDLLHFIEVLQFNQAQYDIWYDLLNLGFRITPTAGTDFPCGNNLLPGQERFYTHVDGPIDYEKWLESVRLGKTFVTTGPLLSFYVNRNGIGEEINLDESIDVTVEAEVVYDPERDTVHALELIENGRLVYSYPKLDDSGKIRFKVQHRINETSWLALRTVPTNHYAATSDWLSRRTEAHTAPIYIVLKNSPPLASHPRTRDIAKSWLAVLEMLSFKLSDDHIDQLVEENANRCCDSVPKEVMLNSRENLIKEIDLAVDYFESFPR